FNEEGICHMCQVEERKDSIDWDKRFKELEEKCDKYRGINGDWYDCVIAVSGGKDSHYQTHVMKELMNMNPLLVTVEDNFTMTKAGIHNLKNISREFGCDIISLKPNIKTQKIIMRYTFEKYGKPTYYIDALIYSFPIHMAIRLNIPLVVYGENINYEYGGTQDQETYSALEQFYNDVAYGIPIEELMLDGIMEKDLNFLKYPTIEEMKEANLDPIYLSYYVRWDDYKHYLFAKSRGFKDLSKEWRRSHMIEDWVQVDTMGYLVHAWMKYPKFGHASATDMAARLVKTGVLTREKAIKLVKKHDHDLDPLAIEDFCNFCGYSISEFWQIVDKHYNRDIFEKDRHGQWKLKNPIWEQEKNK
ncbi:MAG: N-acetyl sugar amidotransferase, partial [Promethearchaeota archaeon]